MKPSRPCLVCAEQFNPTHSLQVMRGPACYVVTKRQREQVNRDKRLGRVSQSRPLQKPCAVCERPFAPASLTAKHCSDDCRMKAQRRSVRVYETRKKAARALVDGDLAEAA